MIPKPANQVPQAFRLGIPVGATAVVFEMFVKAKLGRSEGELAPFEDGRRHGFDGGFQEFGGILIGGSGAEGVAAGEDGGARGAAEGGGIGSGVAGAAGGELIDVGCFNVVGTVAG